MENAIKVVFGALDTFGQMQDIVLRGVIDPESLSKLKVDDYQREILAASKIKELANAFKTGGVPDIELGMRGGNFQENSGIYYLLDGVYIIDGLQRRTAALMLLRDGGSPRLGCTVHFNTDKEWERERFRLLNVSRTKLSANVLLRNEGENNEMVNMLISLCKDSTFALCNRVSWEQYMRREHLLGGNLLMRGVAVLHRRFQSSMLHGNYRLQAIGLNNLMNRVGRSVVRENVKRFWECMDECFEVRATAYSISAPYLRGGWITSISNVFSSHRNFWSDANLDIPREFQKKLATFPIRDPQVAALCAASGKNRHILYDIIVRHLNSGKRTRWLERFDEVAYKDPDDPKE